MQFTAVLVNADNTMKPVTVHGPKADVTALYTACGFRSNRSFIMISEWPADNDSIQLWGKTTGTATSKNVDLSEFAKESVYGRSIFVRINPTTENIMNTDEKQVRSAVGMQTAEDEEEEEEEEDELQEDVEDDDEDEDDDEEEEDDDVLEEEEGECDGTELSVPIICPEKELHEEEYLSYSDEE